MGTRREPAPRDTALEKQGKLLVELLRSGKSEHQRRILIWGGLRLLATAAVGILGLALFGLVAPILPRAAGVFLSILAWAGIGWLVWRHWVRPPRAACRGNRVQRARRSSSASAARPPAVRSTSWPRRSSAPTRKPAGCS